MVQLGVNGDGQAMVGRGLAAGRKRARTRWGPDDPAEAPTTGDADQAGNADPAAAAPLKDLPSNGTAPVAKRKPKRTRWVADEGNATATETTEDPSVPPAVSLETWLDAHYEACMQGAP
jgi:hypothetical protein